MSLVTSGVRRMLHLPSARSAGRRGCIGGTQTMLGSIVRRQRGDFSPETELTVEEITSIIQRNEFALDFAASAGAGPIRSYESNQLASNSPCEDVRSEATCLHTGGHLFGVFDGHAGGSCAQIIAKRLLRYIGTGLVPASRLRELLDAGARSDSFLQCHNDRVDFVAQIQSVYEESFARYAHDLVQQSPLLLDQQQQQQSFSSNSFGGGDDAAAAGIDTVARIMEHASVRLDADLSAEALQSDCSDERMMAVAMSGAVACTVHVVDNVLHVCSTGDCAAVLGSQTETGQWQTRKLSATHSAENSSEVQRIRSEHPTSERYTVLRAERLLGQLAPLRAFGDFRYKWPRETLLEQVEPRYGKCVAPGYLTPPYLTARPEVTRHVLTPRDRFLVIATDGLWDMISPLQAVQLVGEHMSGKAFLRPLRLPRKNMAMGEISNMLEARKVGLSIKPLDANVASHLIRNALGGTEYGIEHTKISHLLTLPEEIVRMFRDDITVTVVYFDSEFIRNAATGTAPVSPQMDTTTTECT